MTVMIAVAVFLGAMLYAAVLVLGVVVIHEAGHAIAAVCCGHKIVRVGMRGTGPYVHHDHPTPGWGNRMIITAAGPAINLIASLVFMLIGNNGYALVNVVFGLINLLSQNPASDGSRLLWAYREWRKIAYSTA